MFHTYQLIFLSNVRLHPIEWIMRRLVATMNRNTCLSVSAPRSLRWINTAGERQFTPEEQMRDAGCVPYALLFVFCSWLGRVMQASRNEFLHQVSAVLFLLHHRGLDARLLLLVRAWQEASSHGARPPRRHCQRRCVPGFQRCCVHYRVRSIVRSLCCNNVNISNNNNNSGLRLLLAVVVCVVVVVVVVCGGGGGGGGSSGGSGAWCLVVVVLLFVLSSGPVMCAVCHVLCAARVALANGRCSLHVDGGFRISHRIPGIHTPIEVSQSD